MLAEDLKDQAIYLNVNLMDRRNKMKYKKMTSTLLYVDVLNVFGFSAMCSFNIIL